MRKAPRRLLAALIGAFITVFAFPFLIHAHSVNAVTKKDEDKNLTWGKIKNLYNGAPADSIPQQPPPKT